MEKINPILKKYAGIDMKGRERIKSADFKIFTGFDESLQNRFLTAAEFSSDSINLLRERVLNELIEIENSLEVTFAMAGRDFPIHSTLMEGLFENTQMEDRANIFDELSKKINIEINGSEIAFDYVLIDGGNLLLVAKDIPSNILEIRDKLYEDYSAEGAKPMSMENILHISLARIIDLPADFDSEEYTKTLIGIRHAISSDPLVLTVENVVKDQTYSYLTATK